MITFADLKQTLDDMKQAADKLLEVTKELKEVVSKSWIKYLKGHDSSVLIHTFFTKRRGLPAPIRLVTLLLQPFIECLLDCP